jgi:hypothetical protein
MLPEHLNGVDPYLKFKGSDRNKMVRRGLVDIIIPNGAGPEVLRRLIDSMLANLSYTITNSYGKKVSGVRIIVVSQGEHGSHDYLRKLRSQFPDTVFPVFKKENFPPPIPYNDGLEFSARIMDPLSEYIMFLDDDMVVLKQGLVEAELDHLEKHGFANVATEHCYFGDYSKLGDNYEAEDFGMGSFFFRRKLFEKIGYLDEFFKFHCADSDYNRRIRLKGNKIALVPNSNQYMFHEHQRGTHNVFKGSHQKVINKDWEMYADKWFHEPHGKLLDLECEKCKLIAATQLPLGRKNYLDEDKLTKFELVG